MGWFWTLRRPARDAARAPPVAGAGAARVPGSVQELSRPALPGDATSTSGRTSWASSTTCSRPGARPSPTACRRCRRAPATTDIELLAKRRDAVAGEIARGEAAGDGVAFADAKELELLERVKDAAGRARRAERRSRGRRRCATACASSAACSPWQLGQDADRPRLGPAEASCERIDAELVEAGARDAALARRRSDEPARFERFGQRIAALDAAAQRHDPARRGAEPRAAARRSRTSPSPSSPASRSAGRLHAQARFARRPALRPRLRQHRSAERAAGQALSALATACAGARCWPRRASLAACSMFGCGKKRHAGQRADLEDARQPRGRRSTRTASSPQRGARRSTPTASSSTSRRRPRSAPRRCAASATSRWTSADNKSQARAPPQRGARLQGGDRPLREYLKAYPNDPDNDRVLYQLARAHEQGGDLEHGARDARPAGQGLSAQRATATRPSSAAASCCSPRKDYPNAEKAFATVLASGPTESRTTTARSTCRAGRSSSRAGSRMR